MKGSKLLIFFIIILFFNNLYANNYKIEYLINKIKACNTISNIEKVNDELSKIINDENEDYSVKMKSKVLYNFLDAMLSKYFVEKDDLDKAMDMLGMAREEIKGFKFKIFRTNLNQMIFYFIYNDNEEWLKFKIIFKGLNTVSKELSTLCTTEFYISSNTYRGFHCETKNNMFHNVRLSEIRTYKKDF